MNDSDIILDDCSLILNDVDNSEETMWELLVDKIMDGSVVPVIGEKIVLENKRTVNQMVIDSISRTFGINSNPQNYSQLFYDNNYKYDKDLIYGKLSMIMNNNQSKFVPSELLKRVLSIQQFPFVITTTIDYTVENTMRKIWEERERDLKVLVFNDNPKDVSTFGDITKDSDMQIPTLYYMFGKANNSRLHSFVVTDEDILAFCRSWLTEDKRPQKLSRELGDKFLLFLGCDYPDWLVRFIWYSMRQDLDKSGMLVGEGAEDSLIEFLNRMHVNTQKNPEIVITELERRIEKRVKEYNDDKFNAPKERTDVFISYCRINGAEAERLYDALTYKGLNVWYDRENLAAGDKWLEKIYKAIKTTKFCVVLISKLMLSQVNESHVYRKEWNMAIEHSRGMGGKRGFIIPVLIDDVDLYDETLDLPAELQTHNAVSLTPDFTMNDIAQCVLDRVNDLAK